MPNAATLPNFDGHNDLLSKLYGIAPEKRMDVWLNGDGKGHLDLKRMKKGKFCGGFFAIYVSSNGMPDHSRNMSGASYDVPLPPMIPTAEAVAPALEMAGIMVQMARASKGEFEICTTAAGLRDCLKAGKISGIMHIEGAEAIGPDFATLDAFYAAGLRSIGPVWSRPTIFAHGVPFRFPSTGDIGPGLTDAGRALVRECNARGIMLDMSHLNEAGFWDVAKLSKAPIVATHSNANAICPSSRNLTDKQLDAIRDSGGMVGLNYAVSFLRPKGDKDADTPFEILLQHFDHLIERLGEDHVGFGSDFDGAVIPQQIGDVTGMVDFQAAMRAHGYNDALMKKLCYENWFNVLERTWGG